MLYCFHNCFENVNGCDYMNLSFDLENFIQEFSKSCIKAQKKTFVKNEVITSYIEKRSQFCILISGNADLVRYDFNGNRTIVELFYNVITNNELLVEAREKCEVLFYPYNNIHSKCRNNCKFHQQLSEYIPELILYKITNLNARIELLTKRSTRDKLIDYFISLSAQTFSKSFKLPLSLTDLADYLGVDRSAMMRELKLLKEDGFIQKEGNRITLLYK